MGGELQWLFDVNSIVDFMLGNTKVTIKVSRRHVKGNSHDDDPTETSPIHPPKNLPFLN